MSRSSKKGPYIDAKLLEKVMKQKEAGSTGGASGTRTAIKTWARGCQIPPQFVGHSFLVHQGKNFVTVFVTESMVGHYLGEFAPTRTFRGHGTVAKRTQEKT
ncbi:MAG: 30S ribosomal protein S19 [Candidatus Daviesbacteria bacterium]|nr:30S ribosomal protein S19 [Candidatus Daviesbacteria bacterium]